MNSVRRLKSLLGCRGPRSRQDSSSDSSMMWDTNRAICRCWSLSCEFEPDGVSEEEAGKTIETMYGVMIGWIENQVKQG